VAEASRILDRIAGDGTSPAPERDGGWLAIRLDPSRAAEVNRALATAGIYASGLETGSDLESLFLELTRSEQPTSHEGTMSGPVGGGQAGASGPGANAGSSGGGAGRPGDGAGAA